MTKISTKENLSSLTNSRQGHAIPACLPWTVHTVALNTLLPWPMTIWPQSQCTPLVCHGLLCISTICDVHCSSCLVHTDR